MIKNYITHSYTTQGKRNYQEDSYVIKNYLNSCSDKSNTETTQFTRLNVNLFGVFDGHGGGEISKAVSKLLPHYFYKQNFLEDNVPKPSNNYNKYIISTFDNIQNQLNATHSKSTLQGSTICLCLIYEYKGKNIITSFWSGDSRAIACNQNLIAESLTLDHKPECPLERQRIKKLGGTVTIEKGDVARINGVLAVSRSIGDFDQKQFVEHKPDITHNICNYKFIVVATDGLWDVMTNQQVVDFVLNEIFDNSGIMLSDITRKSENNVASKLAEEAIRLGSEDNITVIVQFLDVKQENYLKYCELNI